MLFAPESQQVTDQFASEIEDLRTIARMHNFATGSPDRLAALPLRLSKDARLRSDITEFVRSLQTRDPGLALPEALSMVLAAVGGPSALYRNRDLAEAIDLTGGFLASLGRWPGSDVEPLTDLDNPPDHDPRLDLAASSAAEARQGDLTSRTNLQDSAGKVSSAPEIEEVTVRDTDGSISLAEITHALARLERGNLELRLHLDSIDQRICRMEPLLEASPTALAPEPEPEPPSPPERPSVSFAAAAEAPLVHRGSEPSAGTQRDRQSGLSGSQDSLDVLKEQRRISLTSNFPELSASAPRAVTQPVAAESVPRPSAPAAVAVTDPVSHPRMPRRDRFAAAREIPGTAAEFDPLYSAPEAELPSRVATDASPRQASSPAAAEIEAWQTYNAEAGEPTVVASSASSLEAPEKLDDFAPKPLPMNPEPLPTRQARIQAQEPALPLIESSPLRSFAVAEPLKRRRSLWLPSIAAAVVVGAAGFLYVNGLPSPLNEWVGGGSTAASTQVATDTAQSATDSSSAASRTELPAARTGAGTSASSSDRGPGGRDSFPPNQSVERVSGPTFVPGGVMDGYLVAAPRPEYPRLASLAGIKGKVSMEAMISKDGQIEALKVLGGPQLLRDAATNAVKQWQYRPFEVKGRPVEVRTIIRVDVASHADASPAE